MKPVPFKYVNKTLQPSGATHSQNVSGVDSLPIWTDGEQCLSRWRLSWRDRLRVLIYGHVWLAVLSGATQPPVCLDAEREYLKEVA